MADPPVPTPGPRVAVVTGANHGIGAATAVALAAADIDVLVTYLRFHDEVDPGLPAAYAVDRARGGDAALGCRNGGLAHDGSSMTVIGLPFVQDGRAPLRQDDAMDTAPSRMAVLPVPEESL